MKIVTILGARPQFIKAGTVSRQITEYNEKSTTSPKITEVIVHTGQHFDENMSDIFFREMKIPKPHYNLDINGLGHGAMTGQMLEKIEAVLLTEKPDVVLVYGDTNSTIAGALAASKLHIKVAHVEAGLRSFNMKMPEEINRILTDRISDFLFCPTNTAVENLKREGFPFVTATNRDQSIHNVGDVMQDGALFYKNLAVKPPHIDIAPLNYILATVHRAENTDDAQRLGNILSSLNEIAEKTPIVLPLHPRTKQLIPASFKFHPDISVIDPVGYLNMVWLIDNCKLVMTDSGGLQKEAFFFQKPCITLRDETEWIELVDNGFNTLVGANKTQIVSAYRKIVDQKTIPDYTLNLYGGGNASERIVKVLLNHV